MWSSFWKGERGGYTCRIRGGNRAVLDRSWGEDRRLLSNPVVNGVVVLSPGSAEVGLSRIGIAERSEDSSVSIAGGLQMRQHRQGCQ
jgi:hypothetical protein